MNAPFEFAAVIFDVDGTLIDSNAAHAETWAQALREDGLDIEVAEVRPLIGMGGDKLLPALVGVEEDSDRGKSIVARKKELFNKRLPQLLPTNGARDLVVFLRRSGIGVVIATSSGKDDMHALLERAGVADLFDEHASKDDADRSKPDPDIVKAALERAGVEANKACLVGDTPYNVEAARRAGVSTIAVRCGGYWPTTAFSDAADVVADPAALLKQLMRQQTAASTVA